MPGSHTENFLFIKKNYIAPSVLEKCYFDYSRFYFIL